MNRRIFLAGLAALAAPAQAKRRIQYAGFAYIHFASVEKAGTLIIDTDQKVLFQILGQGRAVRYGVSVGKEGFEWSGVARVGRKQEWPRWTPPTAMIKRRPELAQWADGMEGGPKNPLGARAMYLFNKQGDTGFRIHGTNEPDSIGYAASSGCIRMLNEEVSMLYDEVPIGTKVIVL